MYHRSGRGSKKRQYQDEQRQQGVTCTLCSDITKDVIEQTDSFYLIENIFPYEHWDGQGVTEHNLIITKDHTRYLKDLDQAQRSELIDLIAKYEHLGFNMYKRSQHNNKGSIPGHIHWHLIKVDQKSIDSLQFSLDPYHLEFTQKS